MLPGWISYNEHLYNNAYGYQYAIILLDVNVSEDLLSWCNIHECRLTHDRVLYKNDCTSWEQNEFGTDVLMLLTNNNESFQLAKLTWL
jgi:hypothetical protein